MRLVFLNNIPFTGQTEIKESFLFTAKALIYRMGGAMLTRVSRDLSYSLRSCEALKLLFKSYNQSIIDSITAISLSPLQSQPSPFTTTTSQRRPPSKPMMHIAYSHITNIYKTFPYFRSFSLLPYFDHDALTHDAATCYAI